nr:hypothetical protein F511_09447 [Tanacetum cinerariifolium]
VPGIIESWTICSEDWIERDSTIAYEDYKKRYWDYSKELNPVKFNPEQWASVAKKAGMRYLPRCEHAAHRGDGPPGPARPAHGRPHRARPLRELPDARAKST